LVFIGAIPAAITAIIGLAAAAGTAAAAFAAMAGFGALGFAMEDGELQMDNLTEAFEEVRSDFFDAFTPLAERLQPLFEDALEGLDRLFNAIASEGDALMALTDEARAFGQFVIDFVPEALRALSALANGLSGIFGNIGEFIQNNFANGMRTLVKLTAEIVPHLAEFVMVILNALPAIVRMSAGFLRVATSVIKFLGAIGRLFGLLGIGPEMFGLITASLLALISLFALGSSIIGSVFVTSLWSAITSLYAFTLGSYAAAGGLTFLGSTAISGVIAALVGFVASLISGAAALLGFTISAYEAAAAAAALITLLTLGAGVAIVGMAMSAAGAFTSMAGGVNEATSALKEFDKVQSGMAGNGFGAGGSDNPYGFTPDDPDNSPGSSGGVTVFNVESSGDPEEDRSNLDHGSWWSGRTSGGGGS